MKYVRFFAVFFFEILPKFSIFVNSDDCSGRMTPKSIELQPIFIKKKKFKSIKKTDFF